MKFDQNGHVIPDVYDAPIGGRQLSPQEIAALKSGARADSQRNQLHGGLIRREITDDFSGRKSYEYDLPPGQTKARTWMSPYMTAPRLQLAIRNSSPQHEFDRVAAVNLEAARAAGMTND